MSPVRSFARKSSTNGNSDSGSQSMHMCQADYQASTDKNNLTKKKNNLPSSRGLFTMSDYKCLALDINIEARVKPPGVI